MNEDIKVLRNYGFQLLINNFEPLLRKYIFERVILIQYGLQDWKKGVPQGVFNVIKEEKSEIDLSLVEPNVFFDEVYLWCLKEIAIYSKNYNYIKDFVGKLDKKIFIESMDELNEYRRKITHAKSTYTQLDFEHTILLLKKLCQGENSKDMLDYIGKEGYKTVTSIPEEFLEEYSCPNNLPVEDYDLEGGFVGRKSEVKEIQKLLYSAQDRIITIKGAGGLGKTATALKSAYRILSDYNNPFEAIIWFSAKENKLTPDRGIVKIETEIQTSEQLIKNILNLVNPQMYNSFKEGCVKLEQYRESLLKIFESQRCLLIIDNLETIHEEDILDFIKKVPRPSQVLITSRRGLRQLEYPFDLPDFDKSDAVTLFRLISKKRNRLDLLKLKNEDINSLCERVKNYPLLIKWSIGRICLGKDIESSFNAIYSGKSDIAQFIFNDIFSLFSDNAKACLYGMIILGDKPISKYLLLHLTGIGDESFEEGIDELITTSFIFTTLIKEDETYVTHYEMLSLTRGFVSTKLDEEQEILNRLQTKYFELSHQVELAEKSRQAYTQSLFSLGIKTEEEKIAFNYIKTAKNFLRNENLEECAKYFDKAYSVAPNCVYVLVEFAKFEFNRGHCPKGLELFEKAVKVGKKNFHAYFSYGICLRKQNRLDDSIKILQKAKELNKDYLPIYNELGRSYCFKGNYDFANKEFELSKESEKNSNYKHRLITVQSQADNARRWSEVYFRKKDFKTGLEKLNFAFILIEEINKSDFRDWRTMILEKTICKDIAINFCKKGDFDLAIPYFERCFKPIELPNTVTIRSDKEMIQSYYYYCYYALKFKKIENSEILKSINKAMAMNHDPELADKLAFIKRKISKNGDDSLEYGEIIFYNWRLKYGLINSNNKTLIFFLNNFQKQLNQEEISSLSERKVSFIKRISPKDKEKYVADKISLLD